MNTFFASRSSLKGALKVPSSKSQTLRAILFAALAEGTSEILYPLLSQDSEAMLRCVKYLGAKVIESENKLVIQGTGGKFNPSESPLDVDNSGICLRFLTAILALSPRLSTITGDRSLQNRRPMQKLIDALKELDAQVQSLQKEGFAPLSIQGPLSGFSTTVFGEDSQPVSALLIAAALKPSPTTIHVVSPGELPWVEMTLHWLAKLNIPYEREGYTLFKLEGGSSLKAFDYTVPGDFSSAAFPLAAALITRSELKLENLDMNDPQGDKKLLDIAQAMGASLRYDEKGRTLTIIPPSTLKAVEVDVNAFIDAVPILAALACYAEGTTVIKGAKVAREKECDRLKASCQELTKMGADIQESAEGLTIRGRPLKGTEVYSHDDHRMAMSLAIAGMGASGTTKVASAACVAKTYPSFLKDFRALGASLHD